MRNWALLSGSGVAVLTNSVQNSIYAPHAEQAQQQKRQNGAFVSPSLHLHGKVRFGQNCINDACLTIVLSLRVIIQHATHKHTHTYIHTYIHRYVQQTYIADRHTYRRTDTHLQPGKATYLYTMNKHPDVRPQNRMYETQLCVIHQNLK